MWFKEPRVYSHTQSDSALYSQLATLPLKGSVKLLISEVDLLLCWRML